MSTRRVAYAATLVFAAAFASCDRPSAVPDYVPPARSDSEGSAEGSGAVEADPLPAVVLVRIQNTGVRIAPGEPPMQLRAVALDVDRQPIREAPITWHALDPDKLHVTSDGMLSALGPLGPAFVTASSGDILAESLPIYIVDPSALPRDEGSGEGSGDASGDGSGPGEPPGKPPGPIGGP